MDKPIDQSDGRHDPRKAKTYNREQKQVITHFLSARVLAQNQHGSSILHIPPSPCSSWRLKRGAHESLATLLHGLISARYIDFHKTV
jgi:hypothetical protein